MNRSAPVIAAVTAAAAITVWYASSAAEQRRPEVKLLLENDRVRMREIVLPPGSSTGQHTHQVPELAYSFDDGELQVAVPGQPVTIERWGAGQANWRAAGVTHDLTNVGTTDMRVLVIDVK